MSIFNIDLHERKWRIGLAAVAALAIDGVFSVPAGADATGALWNGKDKPRTAVLGFYPGTNGAMYVAAGDVNGDGVPDIIAGNGPGSPDTIEYSSYDASTGFQPPQAPFGPGSTTAGLRVAAGDINGDGTTAIFTGSASGTSSVLSHAWKYQVSINAYSYPQTNGIYVAMGDVNGDGKAEIITGPSTGDATSGVPQSPVINIYSSQGSSITPLSTITPFGGNYTGGVRVATGDLNGDGEDTIIAAPDQGLNPTLAFYDRFKFPGLTVDSYGSTQGVFVAAGDLNGDGVDELITGAGPGGLPYVTVYSFDVATLSWSFDYNFLAYDASYLGGVDVAAGAVDGSGFEGIITSPAGAVPEPASMSILIGGTALLGRRMRRRGSPAPSGAS